MFNRQSVFFGGETTNSTNIKVNAVSGGIVKNHKESYFLRFNLKGELANTLLSTEPHRLVAYYESYDTQRKWPSSRKKLVEVLQLVVVGDMEVVAEVIDLPEPEAQEQE